MKILLYESRSKSSCNLCLRKCWFGGNYSGNSYGVKNFIKIIMKNNLPIGIVTFKTRFRLAKELFRLSLQTLLGDSWVESTTKNTKKVKICFTIKSK